jgi:hypothetical protein
VAGQSRSARERKECLVRAGGAATRTQRERWLLGREPRFQGSSRDQVPPAEERVRAPVRFPRMRGVGSRSAGSFPLRLPGRCAVGPSTIPRDQGGIDCQIELLGLAGRARYQSPSGHRRGRDFGGHRRQSQPHNLSTVLRRGLLLVQYVVVYFYPSTGN